jgi:hypothetical protein
LSGPRKKAVEIMDGPVHGVDIITTRQDHEEKKERKPGIFWALALEGPRASNGQKTCRKEGIQHSLNGKKRAESVADPYEGV